MKSNTSTKTKNLKSNKKTIFNIVEIITAPFNVLLKRQAITTSTKSEINQFLVLAISIAIVIILVLLYYRGVIFKWFQIPLLNILRKDH